MTLHPYNQHLQHLTRRHFLRDSMAGVGSIALGSLLNESRAAVVDPMAVKASLSKGKAKQVIYLHLTGSPPHLDLWDYKPELVKRNGQECPDEFIKGKRFAFTTGTPKLLGTPRTFSRHGSDGLWLSDAIPNLQTVADELCVITSMNRPA